MRVGHIRGVRVMLSTHRGLCSKPFMKWRGQNLVGMARQGPPYSPIPLGSGLMATTGGSGTGVFEWF